MGSDFEASRRTPMPLRRRIPIGLTGLLVAFWPTGLVGQDVAPSGWHVGTSYTQAFGGWGWGIKGGFSAALEGPFRAPSRITAEAFWTKPSLSGSRTFGVPERRVLWGATADVRTRIAELPGAAWIEVGIPFGLMESRVGEPEVREIFLDPSYNNSGNELGMAIGVLGGLGVRLTSAVALKAESKALLSNLYADGFERWIGAHELGLAFSLP